ncbi:MAG: MBL fold metallo-hydrolase [Synergistaceae bacterium]|jgi:glyoxylase-like metal-dependent hydrolase (beta-lactamase superfamily II)|nr:MBL fold metallo-hydrolase [Synergistaceae bacterium]
MGAMILKCVWFVFLVVGVLSFLIFGVREGYAAYGGKDAIFRSKVGLFDVYTLPERQSEGNVSILIGASSRDIDEYIPTGAYPTAVNAFAVKTPDGVILIDTGLGQNLALNLKSVGLSPEDIDSVLITHSHGDHIGGLLKDGAPAFPNAKVYISAAEFEWSHQVRRSLLGYEGRVNRFTPGGLDDSGTELMKGIRAIAAYGHTPGHTLFMIESAEERLLVWGDLTHAITIQAPRPDISVTYDSDPLQAAAARKEVLKFAAETSTPIAGMHIAYPGIGKIEPDSKRAGSYKFVPSSE